MGLFNTGAGDGMKEYKRGRTVGRFSSGAKVDAEKKYAKKLERQARAAEKREIRREAQRMAKQEAKEMKKAEKKGGFWS